MKAVVEVLQSKMARAASAAEVTRSTARSSRRPAGAPSRRITVQQGIATEKARQIVKLIKDSKLKVQAQIQGDQVRVSGKNRDDLQRVIQLLKQQELDVAAAVRQLPRVTPLGGRAARSRPRRLVRRWMQIGLGEDVPAVAERRVTLRGTVWSRHRARLNVGPETALAGITKTSSAPLAPLGDAHEDVAVLAVPPSVAVEVEAPALVVVRVPLAAHGDGVRVATREGDP